MSCYDRLTLSRQVMMFGNLNHNLIKHYMPVFVKLSAVSPISIGSELICLPSLSLLYSRKIDDDSAGDDF